jgi:hypothetical protein
MLQTAGEENPTAEHADASEYVCVKCHNNTIESRTGVYSQGEHTTSASNINHTADLVGTDRVNTGDDGHITGIACLNCHDGNIGFGAVHGFSDATYEAGPVGSGGEGTYYKRRFLPGSGLAGYDPSSGDGTPTPPTSDAAWEMTPNNADNTCYTLGMGQQTGISGCTQHGGGTNANFRGIQRPVDY